MIGEFQTGRARVESARMACPEKANPNRPAPAASGPWRETRGEARPFPDRCDPRHAHRPLDDERRELVTRYMPLAKTLARQARGQWVENDELQAEAYAALVEAARTFDPDRGVDFAVHARPRILGALRDYRRFLFQANWRGRTDESPVFLPPSQSDELNGRVLGREPEAPLGRDAELSEAVAAAIRQLPRSESVACRMLYVEGKSYDETAEVLGCSKGYVSRLQSGAIERLRRHHQEALVG